MILEGMVRGLTNELFGPHLVQMITSVKVAAKCWQGLNKGNS